MTAKAEAKMSIPPLGPTRWQRWRRWLWAGLALIGLPHLYMLLLAILPAPVTLNMVLDDRPLRKDWTRLERISPHLVNSVIGAEDSRFCAHSGIDWQATEEVLEERRAGRTSRGASTITQQTAKNVFFWNGGGFVRKAGEAWFALLIDRIWGKRRVMEVYLNVAEWGDGLYGAEAASLARFGKPAAELTRREAALLAAVLPSPNKWRVDPPGPYVQGRAATLQARAEVVAGERLSSCVLGNGG